MASRRLVAAAAAAAAARSPPARIVSRPGLTGPAGRYWPDKVKFWEDGWKTSRGFSTEVREPAGKARSGSMWNRATYPIHWIKHRMEIADMQERAMALYVYTVFTLGTSTVIWLKTARDICYGV